MESTAHRAIAIVGAGAVLPDAPNVATFWENIKNGRYSITDVTPDRWDPAFYYDPDPKAPDKTYSKIGGWVREFVWDPMKWRLPLPPRVVDAMDGAQRWAIAATREALEDYGYPKRALDLDRTAVILGNAMAGEKHYFTALRVFFPEYAHELAESASFAALPEALRREITRELHERMDKHLPEVTEDSMPGELANCIAGRIANLFNFHGPNYVCDAACASAMAAISAAVEGLVQRHYDTVITGGIDRNMGSPTFVKFCKIGALSATGTRPFAEGADGFVMGEGAALFLLKRLADAERDGDKIYAVLRGMGGSSDGKGKGITAPNPAGQKFAIERAWQNAGLSPATVTLIEGHGTSTRVGDVVEVQSVTDALNSFHLPAGSVALGSVKSNIGHLKGAAGAAGLLKAALALHDKVLPPSVNYKRPNPDIDFAHSPLYVNTTLKPWTVPADGVRRAGLSAFGFGGTNFHAVLEEYIPHRLNGNGKRTVAVSEIPAAVINEANMSAKDISRTSSPSYKAPLRGALVIGADSNGALAERLRAVQKEAQAGRAPAPAAPAESDLRAPERVAIDYADAADLATKSAIALKAVAANQPAVWKAVRAQGIFRGRGPAPKIAFLYTGQGSQYVNMLQTIRAQEPIIAEMFAEADRIMTPLLGKPLTEFIYVDQSNPEAVAKAEEDLRQTEITQPAVMAIDTAMTKLLAAYGITPDFTMGHSVGEYGALIGSGALPFADALEAVSARGRGMAQVTVTDRGLMAAVFAPLEEVERTLKTIDGYVVIANINSEHQTVIGGSSEAVKKTIETFQKAGYEVAVLPVSHAFHTEIVAPVSGPLHKALERLHFESPRIPIVANVNGEFYPTGSDVVPQMLDMLSRQVAAPVQFVKGLRTLYAAGARVFVEVGPKKALQGFADDVLGGYGDVVALFTNHPKFGDIPSFNQALCGLYAAGLGHGVPEAKADFAVRPAASARSLGITEVPKPVPVAASSPTAAPVAFSSNTPSAKTPQNGDHYVELGRMFAEVLERGWQMYHGQESVPAQQTVAITGAALGLPGTEHIFDDSNIGRILRGEQFIDAIPTRFRRAMLDKHITRLVKSDNGGPTFETINNAADVIKLAGRGGAFDLESEFGVSADRLAALDRVTQLAIAVGIDALRDAGIPLVLRYKTTSKGTKLPDRWGLPDALRDDTGVIFASAFPGYDSFADDISRYFADRSLREQVSLLESLRARITDVNGHSAVEQEIDRRTEDLRDAIEKKPYVFDRRFLFRTLSMGHSQFAEFIGARGPNTAINAACASTTQAVALAEDWIRAGRCRRVIVISADDVTSDHMIEWFGAGFLASGAAATDEVVEEAAIPFDRRRHGMIVGMGAAALVVESVEAMRERGIQPICEVLSTVTANSAFHGTRLDVQHIGQMMEDLVARAEARHGIKRQEIAPRTVFVSHETYTPARGGSASAEIHALRRVFGDVADQIVIANTKGFTGHAMGSGIEDVVAVKALETGCVPPVSNFKEVDPELGTLNLSKGGAYPVEYALRLGAGFGSQISLTLVRWVTRDGVRRSPNALGYAYRIVDDAAWKAWLSRMAGYPTADLEIVHRTLRVKDQGRAAQTAEPAPAVRDVPIPAPTPRPKTSVAAPVLVAKASPVTKTALPSPGDSKPQAVVVAATPAVVAATAVVDTNPLVAATPVVSATPAVVSAKAGDAVKERILTLVVEKTGYPSDMLDLDLDLEADLGVDTVKQAEMFAAIREIYNIPRDENRKLRDYPTLAHVIRFVYEKRPDLAGAPVLPISSETHTSAVAAPAPAAVVAVAESPVTSAAIAAQSRGGDSVKERILALVVEKTGYPQDMLDLDLDLEADLGVDTVKQAEMFAAIREIYNIPRDENRKLRDYPTLAHVIRFVYEKRPDLVASPTSSEIRTPALVPAPAYAPTAAMLEVAQAEPSPVIAAHTAADDSVKERILALVVEKTGYPKDMLDLDLDLEADLGVDTVKQAEMFAAIREIYNIPRDENRKLRDYPTLAHVIRFVFEKRPDLAAVPAVPVSSETTVSAKTAAPVAATVNSTSTPVSVRGVLEPTTDELIKEKVLAIVAEKTGYPKDMLDLDLDLEADLGIDTVKQAEMFASVRATFNIPREAELKLRDFPTLAHVIKFARDRQPKTAPPTGDAPVVVKPEQAPPADSATKPAVRPALATFDAANRVPRRVPLPVLRPPLAICKPTGVKVEAGRRVVVMPDKGGVAEALMQRLKTLGAEVLRIEGAPTAEELTSRLKTWLAAGPIHGVYWLPALDYEGHLTEIDAATWQEAVRTRVKLLYTTMRNLYEQVGQAGTFLVSATRLGGQHGYDAAGAVAPLGGAVTGFVKTYKRERSDALVKAVDFEPDCKTADIAEMLLQETLDDPGAVEIGYKNELRWSIGLLEQTAADGKPGLTLDKDTVFVITGAAGSIVSAITADLATASGGTFYLLDLVPEPDPNNPELKRFVSDKEGLKRDLFARIQARGERATPALVEKELAALERAYAAQSAIDAVRAAGGTAHYFSVNLTDGDAVAKVINRIRDVHGRIDVLLHAAGIERSHTLPDKDQREFDLVFDVKSDGFFHLLRAIGNMPLAATVVFSSIAGRFGNFGQTDYSSANDLLCKITSSLRTSHPATRAIVIDWTAWGGIGMAARGSIPKIMEAAGIDMLTPEAGVPMIRRELTAGGTRGEIVIAQRLGVLFNEWDATGGLDPAKAQADKGRVITGPMIGKIASLGLHSGLTIETTLDPKVQPFLFDHQIDGIPVLPGVMGVEAFAEAAAQLLPGWHVEAVEEVNYLAPFKFYRHEPRTVTVEATIYPQEGAVLADCKLIGRRSLPNQGEPQVITYFKARVRLSKEPPAAVKVSAPGKLTGHVIEAADIYRLYFHGPAYQVVKRAWWDGNRIVGLMNSSLRNNHHPADLPTVAAPRFIELCFQTAGILEMGVQGRMGLPLQIGRVSLVRVPDLDAGDLYAVVTPHPDKECFDAEVVDTKGNLYLSLTGYRTVPIPDAVDAGRLKTLQSLMSEQAVVAA
jgi:acyl transferase domain-containing protein